MKTLLALTIAALAVPAAMASNTPEITDKTPILASVTSDPAEFRSALETVLRTQTGRQVVLADGKWQVVYGSRILSAAELSQVDPAEVTAIDILTRKNGSFEGTIVLSRR